MRSGPSEVGLVGRRRRIAWHRGDRGVSLASRTEMGARAGHKARWITRAQRQRRPMSVFRKHARNLLVTARASDVSDFGDPLRTRCARPALADAMANGV